MTALDDALAPYGLRLYREADDHEVHLRLAAEFNRKIFGSRDGTVPDRRPLSELHPEYADPPIRCSLYDAALWDSAESPPVDASQLFAETWDTARSRPIDPDWFHENVEVGRFAFHTEPLHPKITVAPAHHGYDAIVTIAVMPLPPQPEIGNGDHEAWRRYILAMERRGHARALLDGICEGAWEQ